MSVNKSSYAYDPTANQAIGNVMREEKAKKNTPPEKFIYVCSPFSGDIEHNVHNARIYCATVVKEGGIPFAPHLLYPQFMNDSNPKQRKRALHFGLMWLSKCDEIHVFGETISDGMRNEIRKAEMLEKPIIFRREV